MYCVIYPHTLAKHDLIATLQQYDLKHTDMRCTNIPLRAKECGRCGFTWIRVLGRGWSAVFTTFQHFVNGLHTNFCTLCCSWFHVRVKFLRDTDTQVCPRRDLWRATISATWDFELRKSKLFPYSNEVDFVDAVDFVAYNCQQRYTNFLH